MNSVGLVLVVDPQIKVIILTLVVSFIISHMR